MHFLNLLLTHKSSSRDTVLTHLTMLYAIFSYSVMCSKSWNYLEVSTRVLSWILFLFLQGRSRIWRRRSSDLHTTHPPHQSCYLSPSTPATPASYIKEAADSGSVT